MSPLDPGNETLFRSNPGRELFLGQSRLQSFTPQLLADDKGIALHFELVALGSAYGSKILGNKIFNESQIHLFLSPVLRDNIPHMILLHTVKLTN